MKVLTANRLIDGEAVWYCAEKGWIERIGGADVAAELDAKRAIDQGVRLAAGL